MKRLFKIGNRVRPSQHGKDRRIFQKKDYERMGTVVKVDVFNSPTVLWDGRKTVSGYHPDFVEHVDVVVP